MTLAQRYSGTAWYGHFVTTTGTCTLSGDQRNFDWNREDVLEDSTAGADASTNQIGIREANSFTLEVLATTGGTVNWSTYFKPQTEGTLVFSDGIGTADGKPKHTVAVIVRNSKVAYPYAGLVTWNVEFGGQDAVSYGTWSSGA